MRGGLVAIAVVLAASGCGSSASKLAPPTVWRLGASPPAPAGSARFSAVSCVSPSYCIAVGNRLQRFVSAALAERWDGRRWSVLPTNAAADDRSVLTGVSCVSTDFCAAVGSHFTADGSRGLTEVWNGRAW